MQKHNKSTPPKFHIAVLSSVLGLILSGCTVYEPSYPPTTLRNKITVAETVERLELYTQASGLNLSARDEDAVTDFVYQYAESGQGPLYINIPGNSAGGIGVQQAKTAISSRLSSMGIPRSAMQVGQYPSRPGAPAPVVISFRQLATAPIDCQQGAALTRTSTNQPYPNFGCAQTANLAAMIDSPRHLLAPAGTSPLPAIRRTTVMQSYNEGQPTGTPRPVGQEISAGGN